MYKSVTVTCDAIVCTKHVQYPFHIHSKTTHLFVDSILDLFLNLSTNPQRQFSQLKPAQLLPPASISCLPDPSPRGESSLLLGLLVSMSFACQISHPLKFRRRTCSCNLPSNSTPFSSVPSSNNLISRRSYS